MAWLDWPDCLNVRDLEGTQATDGRTILARTLVRSGHHSTLTPAGRDKLEAYGVSRIVDLRGPSELTKRPSPFASDPRYVSCPVSATLDGVETLAGLYADLLRQAAAGFAAAVAAIAAAPGDGAVIVHCHAGKDRSGLVVALALSVVGVPAEVIAADYALTDTDERSVRANRERLAGITDRHERRKREELYSARPETMLATLAHLDGTYGGAEAYLLGTGGLAAEQIALLRRRLTAGSI